MRVASPRLPIDLQVLENLQQLITRDETLSSAVVRNESIDQLIVNGFTATELRLEKVNATQTKLERTSFSDVEFVSCDLIATSFPDSSWRRVSITGSRCSGLQLQTSTLHDISFVDCKLNLANFRFSKLKDVCFKDCVLDEADFYGAELLRVAFQNCHLNKTEFSTSKHRSTDFRTSDIVNIRGVTSLAGSIIDSIQLVTLAPVLASVLSIDVRDV